jgi:Lsr2
VATETQWILVDDLDGGPASTTVEFGLDRQTYAIDLSQENADRLRAVLAEFVAAARERREERAPALRQAPRVRTAVAAPARRPTAASPSGAGAAPAPLPSLGAELVEVVRELADDLRRVLLEVLEAVLDVLREQLVARRVSPGAATTAAGRV